MCRRRARRIRRRQSPGHFRRRDHLGVRRDVDEYSGLSTAVDGRAKTEGVRIGGGRVGAGLRLDADRLVEGRSQAIDNDLQSLGDGVSRPVAGTHQDGVADIVLQIRGSSDRRLKPPSPAKDSAGPGDAAVIAGFQGHDAAALAGPSLALPVIVKSWLKTRAVGGRGDGDGRGVVSSSSVTVASPGLLARRCGSPAS